MDFSYLISISDGDKEFIAQFISTFQNNTSRIIVEMEKSFAEKDFESLQKHAHQLKPSLEMLKLETYDLCLNIQDQPQDATATKISTIKESCIKAADQMIKEFIQ